MNSKLICGDAVEILKSLPTESIDAIVTSPPYWSLRDYQVDGQYGLETTLSEYHDNMLRVTSELFRVLKKSGVCFWNHGDCYGGSWQDYGNRPDNPNSFDRCGAIKTYPPTTRMTSKCLAMQNYRLAIKMVDEQGWILRNIIQWVKPNSMPSSVRDRLANSYEPVFMFVKNNKPLWYVNSKTMLIQYDKPSGTKGQENIDWEWRDCPRCSVGAGDTKIPSDIAETVGSPRARYHRHQTGDCDRCDGTGKVKRSLWASHQYYFDIDTLRVPLAQSTIDRAKYGCYATEPDELRRLHPNSLQSFFDRITSGEVTGRNRGDVWTVNTHPFPDAHFATFPEELIQLMIRASCPMFVCSGCGLPKVRIVKTKYDVHSFKHGVKGLDALARGVNQFENVQYANASAVHQTTGFAQCRCNADFTPGIVLDPFVGAGTTCLVAKKLSRRYIGIDLNVDYVAMAQKRLDEIDAIQLELLI